jgi:hypothetical protein
VAGKNERRSFLRELILHFLAAHVFVGIVNSNDTTMTKHGRKIKSRNMSFAPAFPLSRFSDSGTLFSRLM